MSPAVLDVVFWIVFAVWGGSAILCAVLAVDEFYGWRAEKRQLSEWEARENARPTSSAVNTIYDRPLADVIPIGRANGGDAA